MQEKNARKSNEARSADMRAALITTARRLFADQGYAATGTPEIVKTAGVTRGALYHHFADKADLFRAVVEGEAKAVASQIQAETTDTKDAIDGLTQGATAYFDAISEPGRARLLLVEGPAVLGEQVMAEIDQQTGGDELRLGLQSGVDEGVLIPMPTAEVADLLSAAFDRAALAGTRNEDRNAYIKAISILVNGLKAS